MRGAWKIISSHTRDTPRRRTAGGRNDGQLRAGFAGDRPDAGRVRRRQGRAPRRAFVDRRHPRAGRLLRDGGRLPADHGGSAVDRRSVRSAVTPEPNDRDAIRTLSAEIRGIVEGIVIPDDLAAAITRALAHLGEHAAYAVRSSATAEDLPTASFAGQHDTYLNVGLGGGPRSTSAGAGPRCSPSGP